MSRAELDQVVTLAKQCGLPDVAEVQTFYVPPTTMRRICVTSSKRIADRDTRYECAYMYRIGWHNGEVPPRAKRVGPFWVSKPYAFSVLMRAYQVAGRHVQIQICDGIKKALADAVLTQVAEQKVAFKDEECRSQFNRLDLSKMRSICRDERGTYRLDLCSNTIVRFQVQQGKVVITCVEVEDYVI